MKNKTEQREYLKEIRNGIPHEIRRMKSEKICEKLFGLQEYISANTVMIYMSFGSEVQTDTLFERVLENKKRLVVPRCNADKGKSLMDGYYVSRKSCLERGSYGIYEPSESRGAVIADKNDIDLVIVPGLGFDKDGYRVGYGAGYYDRYLEGYRGKTIGLCFKECVIECIFTNEHDKKVDKIITD